jgi:uncharacterized protein (DUF1778 family)
LARLGRPKAQHTVNMMVRLTEQERTDLRKAAIAENTTLVGFIREAVNRCKRRHQRKGTWPETDERE